VGLPLSSRSGPVFADVRKLSEPAFLSSFLVGNGEGVPDPVDGTLRQFGDLERRQIDLETLLQNGCEDDYEANFAH
jgi:hypothetical protein